MPYLEDHAKATRYVEQFWTILENFVTDGQEDRAKLDPEIHEEDRIVELIPVWVRRFVRCPDS